MGETCVDGARKRAKYLLDAGEQANHAMVEEPAEASVAGPIEASIPAPLHEQPLSQPHQQRQQQQYRQQQQLQTMAQMSALSPPLSSPTFASTSGSRSLAAPVPSADLGVVSPAPLGVTGLHTTPSAANFGSEAINLEYMFLSSMLAYPQFAPSALPPAMEGTAVDAASGMQGQCPAIGPGVVASIPSALWATQPTVPLPPLLSPPQHNPAALISPPPVNDAQAAVDRGAFDGGLALGRQHYEQWPPRSMVRDRTAQTANGTQPHGSAPQKTAAAQPSPPPHAQIVSDDTHHPLSRPPTTGPAVYGLNPVYPQSPAEVYSSVTEPYKYYNGFHFFFRHISGRMDKKDIMRVSRAIAHFRPSLVAQLRNLTRDDLIFMEKSFQRALMEYEKLIVFIGTPTVVWRRSGEIALVGKEFSILTQWDRQLLMSGNKFIFELMDTKSAVVYWEQFAVHAFENSEHSVMSECRLVRPDGVAVPCAFSFTIKRDLFGIPMAIIGNFLPIL
ncbi:Transcriptional regulator of nonfermentable carbon utilization [Coemansia thaxteri]|nr:Transcriptional regulator of nonfermentable carbon utilization [Coemansia thaxteri]KAJ2472739.1 Transcriptional regulator of nonfermentable carbon utilization [Coemansia sp. RSA 2322]